MTHGTETNRSSTPPSNDQRSKKHATPPSHNQGLTAITALSVIVTAMLTMTLVLWKPGLSSVDNLTLSKTGIDQATKKPMQCNEYPRCGYWTLEEQVHKNPAENATYSLSKLPNSPPMPSTPNNTPIASPCPPPLSIPPLRLRSEDSGSKERSTTTPGNVGNSLLMGSKTRRQREVEGD